MHDGGNTPPSSPEPTSRRIKETDNRPSARSSHSPPALHPLARRSKSCSAQCVTCMPHSHPPPLWWLGSRAGIVYSSTVRPQAGAAVSHAIAFAHQLCAPALVISSLSEIWFFSSVTVSICRRSKRPLRAVPISPSTRRRHAVFSSTSAAPSRLPLLLEANQPLRALLALVELHTAAG